MSKQAEEPVEPHSLLLSRCLGGGEYVPSDPSTAAFAYELSDFEHFFSFLFFFLLDLTYISIIGSGVGLNPI